MPKKELAKLLKKEQLKPDIFKISLEAPEIVADAKPGNFIDLLVFTIWIKKKEFLK